jgi:AcrR family transcriptional regulator
MPGKGDRYHHGDLRAALIDTAAELIAERGVRGFSLAEASRRLGVAVSAPYAHFADRDDLLAAVAVHAFELFRDALVPEMDQFREPADRLVAMARAYVRFAATSRPLFEVLYESGIDKTRHPEIEAAEEPLDQAFLDCVRALADGDDHLASELADAVEATAHGHAMLLLDSGPSQDAEAVDLAAERTARAVRALIESRRLLGQPSSRPVQESQGGTR